MTSNDLLLFRASGPGAKLHIPFQVAEDGDYELIAQVAHSLDYGSYAVLLDGKPLGADANAAWGIQIPSSARPQLGR